MVCSFQLFAPYIFPLFLFREKENERCKKTEKISCRAPSNSKRTLLWTIFSDKYVLIRRLLLINILLIILKFTK